MSDNEKKIAKKLADALKKLPQEKAEYFIGYADGVEAAVNANNNERKEDADNDDQ